MSVTIAIIIITSLISIGGFQNQKIINDLIFYPPAIAHQNQWYRFITCGLIHADWAHLFFNMFTLYIFGKYMEESFQQIFENKGKVLYVILYVSSLIVCLLPTYFQQKENIAYRSLGASGAVSAIVFAFMFLYPTQGIGLLFIPIFIPGFIFGPVYLIITSILANKGGSHINHSAHFWGAVYGVVFLIITSHQLSDYNLISNFSEQVRNYFRSF
jgi:membrane associated rhomboid family serine protease